MNRAPLIRALRAVRTAKLRAKQRFGLFDPLRIVPYRGCGTPELLRLEGRLLEADGAREPAGDRFWRNALTVLARLESDEIPGARLLARFGGRACEARTDHEGFFAFEIRPEHPPRPGWHAVELELLGSVAGGRGLRAAGQVLVPEPDAEFGVISDLDDTVIVTAATDRLLMVRICLFRNARTRVPFPGVPELYRALRAGPDRAGRNPIFYVSNCGWNLYDLIEAFMDHHGIPAGPIFMRDVAILEERSPTGGHRQHKLHRIRSLLRTYPELPFVLIGDSGERDPETYSRIAREHPGRIGAVYLRDASRQERDRQVRALAAQLSSLGVPAVLSPDSAAIAEHAAEQGFITPDAARRVRQAVGPGSPAP